MVEKVTEVLNNPAVKMGLKMVAPEVAIFADMIVPAVGLMFGRRRKPKADKLVAVIDEQLADILQDLATTESRARQRELEIRAHTLLGILVKWNDRT